MATGRTLVRNLPGESDDVFVEEERSEDEETSHYAENVG